MGRAACFILGKEDWEPTGSPTCKYVRYLNSKIGDLLKTKQERQFSSEKSGFLTRSQLLPFGQ